jgi:hypothetical protein
VLSYFVLLCLVLSPKLPSAMTGGREISLEGVPNLLAMGVDCYIGDADTESVKATLGANRASGKARIISVTDGLTMVHVCFSRGLMFSFNICVS